MYILVHILSYPQNMRIYVGSVKEIIYQGLFFFFYFVVPSKITEGNDEL